MKKPNNEIVNAIFSDISVNYNVVQDVVVISSDRLELIFRDFRKSIIDNTKWELPLGTFITSLITLSASDFQNFLNIKAIYWESIFWLIMLISLVILVTGLVRLLIKLTIIKNPINHYLNLALQNKSNIVTKATKNSSKNSDTVKVKRVYITISKHVTVDDLKELKMLMLESKGRSPVSLVFEEGNRKVDLKIKVKSSETFFRKVSEILSETKAADDIDIPF